MRKKQCAHGANCVTSHKQIPVLDELLSTFHTIRPMSGFSYVSSIRFGPSSMSKIAVSIHANLDHGCRFQGDKLH